MQTRHISQIDILKCKAKGCITFGLFLTGDYAWLGFESPWLKDIALDFNTANPNLSPRPCTPHSKVRSTYQKLAYAPHTLIPTLTQRPTISTDAASMGLHYGTILFPGFLLPIARSWGVPLEYIGPHGEDITDLYGSLRTIPRVYSI